MAIRIYIHNLTQWLRFRLCTLLVISHRAVWRVWSQLQLSAHLGQGWWVWHLHCRLLSDAANKDWPFIQMFCICTYFLFQMKPQEKVFFKDPVKLIQSRLQHISQVCLLCAEFTPSSLATALLIAILGCLNVRAVSQLITRQWVIQQEIVSVKVIFVIKKRCFRITLRSLVNPWAILQKLNLSYIIFLIFWGLLAPQISLFQRTQMERVTAHYKHKSVELERRLEEVTKQVYRWF